MRQAFIGILTAGMMAATLPAAADTFVWTDRDNGYTMSFPDSWTMQTPDDATTAFRIAGPLPEDRATCRMQVVQDGRLTIYPKRLMDEAAVETLNRDFWDRETGQYDQAVITEYYIPASLSGKGDGSAVQVSFNEDAGEADKAHMHAVSIASIYHDKRYVATCASRADVYERYAGLFTSILDSVELDSRYHPYATGYYRNFLMDPKFVLPNVKRGTANYKNNLWAGKHQQQFIYND